MMKKNLPLALVLVGAALLVTAVVFWIDSYTSTEPHSFGKTLLDWATLIAGLGISIGGWLDLLKKKDNSTPSQNNTNGGVIISGKIDSVGEDVVGGNKTINTYVTEDSVYNVEGLSNPYLGLRAFAFEDHKSYAGRELIASEALEWLIAPGDQKNLLFVTGASGSGKSSFAQAGLLPVLINYYKRRGINVHHSVFRPSFKPKTRLDDVIRQLPADGVQVIIIDQFEELFIQSEADEKHLVIEYLCKLPPFNQCNRIFIVTVRSDYLGNIFEIPVLWASARQGVFLRAMNAQELMKAIQRPLQTQYANGEKRFELALLEKLAKDASESDAYLPLLQVTLEEIWNKGFLKLSGYSNLTDAIKDRANIVLTYRDFDKATPSLRRSQEEQNKIIKILLDLVNVSMGEDVKHDVRVSRRVDDFSNDKIQLLYELSKARLVSITTEDDAEIVMLIHETLIRSWDFLRENISTERIVMQKRSRFELQKNQWLSSRSDKYLLSNLQVEEARELEQMGDIAFQRAEAQDYLRASIKKLEAEQRRIGMLAMVETIEKRAGTKNVSELVNLVLASAVTIMGSEFGNLFVLDRKVDELFIYSSLSGLLETPKSQTSENEIARRVINQNKVIISNEVDSSGNLSEGQSTVLNGTIIATPIYLDGHVLGAICITTNKKNKTFEFEEEDLLVAFVNLTSKWLEPHIENLLSRKNSKETQREQAAEVFGKMAFSASASVHALRNSIGAIKANLQLLPFLGQLGEDAKDSFLKNQVPSTLKRLDEMAKLVDNLHEPWRPVNDAVANVNTCIKHGLEKVFSFDQNSWITLLLSDIPVGIKTAQEMLVEAFRILFSNARDAMAKKAEEEKSLIVKSDLKGDIVEIIIEDNGEGISLENLDRIFEMRYTTKESGLGFGLFWAKDYIEGLRGTISVSSVLREGTTFTITLPIEKIQEGNS